MKIAITDANIFIDLFSLGKLDWLKMLNLEVYTTDLVLNELRPEQAASVRNWVSVVSEFTIDEVSDLGLLDLSGGLSNADKSVIWQTNQMSDPFIVLTGDNLIRKWCTSNEIEVHGILWILDQLIDRNLLSKNEALSFLFRLMRINQWLPPKECEIRIKTWEQLKSHK